MKREQVTELLYQALETEQGGVKVYQTALRCAVNDELKQEWTQYLEETRNHERIMLELLGEMDLDPAVETPGRQVVRHKGAVAGQGDGTGAAGRGTRRPPNSSPRSALLRPRPRTTRAGSSSVCWPRS
jgi:hypothetical protein